MRKTASSCTTQRAALFLTALVLCLTATAFARGPESIHSMQVSPGWNLLSLPASVSDGRTTILFPSAASPAFVFHYSTGYQEQDSLQNGYGFWLKFNSSDTLQITGNTIFEDTIEVQAGWNIIGSLSVPIAVDSIKPLPCPLEVSRPTCLGQRLAQRGPDLRRFVLIAMPLMHP